MYVRPLSPKNKKRLSKWLNDERGKKLNPIPDNWTDFVRLTKIRSGNKIVTFEPYQYQNELVESIESNFGTVVIKSRQLGFTQCIASLFLYKACLNPAYTALILSKNQDDTKKVAERIREMLNCLDDYVESETDNKLHIKIKNGGQIYFRNSKIDGARGIDSVSDVLFDEAGFVDEIDAVYSAVLPCTEMVGDEAKIIVLSTPNGQSGFYWDTLIRNNGSNDFISIIEDIKKDRKSPIQHYSVNSWATFITHWKAHPIYSQKQNYLEDIRDKKGLSWSKVLQEYDLSFIENDVSVFSTDIVRKNIDNETTEGKNKYYIGIDTSGLGNDYTVAYVLEDCGEFYREVEVYRKRKQTSEYNIFKLTELIEKYNPEDVGIEVTGGTGQIYYEQLDGLCLGCKFTPIKTTGESKPQMIDRLKLALEKGRIHYPSNSPIIEELLSFRQKGKKLEAINGKHDDCVMALSFVVTISPIGIGKETPRLFKTVGE